MGAVHKDTISDQLIKDNSNTSLILNSHHYSVLNGVRDGVQLLAGGVIAG